MSLASALCALVAAGFLVLGQPHAVVPVSHADLGVQPATAIVGHEFEVRNEGDQPLSLSVSKRSCRARVSVPRDTVGPGESIHVGLFQEGSTERTGPLHIYSVVDTNDPDMPEVQLTLKTKLVREVETTPTQIDFGNVTPGQEQSAELTVRCCAAADGRLPQIARVTASSNWLRVAEKGVQETQRCASRAYHVSLSIPPESFRDFVGYVAVETTSSAFSRLEVPVKAAIARSATCTPAALLLTASDAGDPYTASIRVQPAEGESLCRAECSDARVSVSVVDGEAPGASQVRVVVDTAGNAGEINSVITLYGCEGAVLGMVPIMGLIGGT